jgi:hypothetical protein
MSEPTNPTDSEFPSARLRAAAQRAQPLAYHGSGTAESEVTAIERLLGITIGGSLRKYLVEFGWMHVGSNVFLGIGPQQPAEQCDLVSDSRFLSRHGRPYVAILGDGGEFVYAFPVGPDGTVVDRIVVLPLHGGEEDEGWPEGLTFGQYVSSLIDEAEARERGMGA